MSKMLDGDLWPLCPCHMLHDDLPSMPTPPQKGQGNRKPRGKAHLLKPHRHKLG